jgi:hypothetical protein
MKQLAGMNAPRGNPNFPEARFLFSIVSQKGLERILIAAMLNRVWKNGLADERNWIKVTAEVMEVAKGVYQDARKGLRTLISLDPVPEFERDFRHLGYHWDHSSYLVEELFKYLSSSKLSPKDFSEFIQTALCQWDGALTKPALEDIAVNYEFRGVVTNPAIVQAVKDADDEFMKFLLTHPDTLDRIAWEAFEKIVMQVFASSGFEVRHIGTQWGQSADLLVVNRSKNSSAMIVEVKRYKNSRKVGLDIVNGVPGAKIRQGADAAFLVTTSTFTKKVERERKKLETLNLFLRDGQQLMEWLNYVCKDKGEPQFLKDGTLPPEALWFPTCWKDG